MKPARPLSSQELDVLESALQKVARLNLPVRRSTEPDGPNEWALAQWTIPRTLVSLGEVEVIENEQAAQVDHIKFRRPRVSGTTADVVLETPNGLCFCSLRLEPTRGWKILAE